VDNVQKLKHYNILDDVRCRLGAKDKNDDSFDEEINEMTAQQIAEKWAGWNLGYESWATEIIKIYNDFSK